MDQSNIGEQIIALRKQNKMTQRDLAKQAGLTHSAISTIEKNKVSPSISSLQKIVNVFSLSLSEFFSLKQVEARRKVVIKPEQLVEIGSDKVSMQLVTDGREDLKLGFLLETYQPGSSTGNKTIQHEGQECGTVLEGEIELQVGDHTYLVRAGESYLFDTSTPHTFTNRSDAPVKLISAHTPPTF